MQFARAGFMYMIHNLNSSTNTTIICSIIMVDMTAQSRVMFHVNVSNQLLIHILQPPPRQ